MIISPCIKVCKLNSDGVCVGCHRTSEEIKNWLSYTDEQKKSIIDKNIIVDTITEELYDDPKYKILDESNDSLLPVLYITQTPDWCTIYNFCIFQGRYRIGIDGLIVNYSYPYPENDTLNFRIYDDIYDWSVYDTYLKLHHSTTTFEFEFNLIGPGHFSLQHNTNCDKPRYLHNLKFKILERTNY